MRIADVRTYPLRFSTAPTTLVSDLVSPTSKFSDHIEKGKAWWGPVSLVVVEVLTDEGITGVGSAGGFTGSCQYIIDHHFRDIVLGESPFNVELIWEKLYRSSVRFGRKGAAVAALSALDIACWDILGKALGQPVYNLLGGKTKETVRAYASRCYALRDLDQLAQEAKGYVEQGFQALKQRFGFGPRDGIAGMKKNEALVRTVREAIGDDIELAADAYMGWDVPYTIEMERRLRDYHLSWIEEPLVPDDLDGYAYLTRELPTRISMGEHEYTRYGFKELIERRVADIYQPDVNRVGGLTEAKKICALAEAHHVPILPHSNEAHNLHLIVSSPACTMIEYFPNVEPADGNTMFWKVFTGEVEASGGSIVPPDRPGLGVELNRDALGEYLYEG